MKRNKPLLIMLTWILVGIMYFPVFFASWLLHIVARLLLSISYFGLLNAKKGRDVFNSLFRFNPSVLG